MKMLLVLTAILEAVAGLTLLVAPATMAWVLLGGALETPESLVVARVAGAALCTLGIACSRAPPEPRNRAASGIVMAMLFYNLALVALMVHARLTLGLVGIGFWPVVVVHSTMAVWCGNAGVWTLYRRRDR